MANTGAAWKRKRAEILDRDGHACSNCGAIGSRLNVHHRFYEAGKKPHEYPNESLETLCPRCHGEADELRRNLNRAIGHLGRGDAMQALGYMQALAVCHEPEETIKVMSYEHAMGIASAFEADADTVIRLATTNIRSIVYVKDLANA